MARRAQSRTRREIRLSPTAGIGRSGCGCNASGPGKRRQLRKRISRTQTSDGNGHSPLRERAQWLGRCRKQRTYRLTPWGGPVRPRKNTAATCPLPIDMGGSKVIVIITTQPPPKQGMLRSSAALGRIAHVNRPTAAMRILGSGGAFVFAAVLSKRP